MNSRRDRPARPWYLYLLGAVAVAVIVLAVTEIGPPSSSARTSRELVNAENGVVQSTVSGSGNVEAGTDVTLNFNTTGNLQAVYVKVGQHVADGQLLATLDPSSAQLQVDQAQAALTAAQDELTEVEDGTATGGGSGSGGSGSSSTNVSLEDPTATTEFVSYSPGKRKPQTKTKTKTVTTVTTTITKNVGGNSGGRGSNGNSGGSDATTTHTATSTSTTPSASSIASAQASVYSAEANLKTAQTALANTKLYAPTAGTVASLSSDTPGQAVSSSSGTGSSSSSASSASSSSAATAGSLGGTGSSSTGSSSSSSGFVQIINKNTLTMTVAFSESDITKVNVGQPATITMDALSGVELGAHVSSISPVGSSSDGVVSYNATLTLDQNNPQVKPGMSATASVIVGQSQGVTVPNQAVTGTGSVGSVELMRNGKTVSQPVIVGLRGATRTVIQSGLSSGDQVVVTITLPSLSSTPSTSSGTGTLGGAGGAGGAGGFRAIFGGGGGGGGGGLRGAGGGGFAGGG